MARKMQALYGADNESYNKAYELWIRYQHECERWDEFVCTGGRDEQGFIKPASHYERNSIIEFASKKRDEILALAKGYGIPPKEFNRAKEDANRLTLDGLVKEYKRIFKREG